MQPLHTQRLTIRPFTRDDAPFILELVNDPDWHRFIGDRNIHTLNAARTYLTDGPIAMVDAHGFGLYHVGLTSTGQSIGMCGLIKRPTLEDVDIGFAFLPAFRGHGYAREAALATLQDGRQRLALKRIVAITSPDNERSQRLLQAIGLHFDSTIQSGDNGEQLNLFAIDYPQ